MQLDIVLVNRAKAKPSFANCLSLLQAQLQQQLDDDDDDY